MVRSARVSRRQFLALLLPLLAVLIAFTVLLALERSGVRGAPLWDEDFARYVRDRIGQDLVWGVGDDRKQWQAEFNAMNAYVRTFDDYGGVTAPWHVEEERARSTGQYHGIGIQIEQPAEGTPEGQGILVTGVQPGGPAASAGVRIGDRIVAVDEWALSAMSSLDDLRDRIRGPLGTSVVLRLRSPEGTERAASVVRAEIEKGSVFGTRIVDGPRGIGYTRVGAFQPGTARDLRAALDRLSQDGMKALVLDLRDNSGGLMDQAVLVANLFLDRGVILRQRGRSRDFTAVHRADPAQAWNPAIPLAVLVNGWVDYEHQGSASASEILAGALQDHRRAVLVGERTFGKFLVQAVEDVPTRPGLALFKRTTSVYETPLGHHYQRRGSPSEGDPLAGLEPDLFVPLTLEERRGLGRVFDDEYYADWKPKGAVPPRAFVDRQLEAARALLAGDAVIAPIAPP
jgi:carboxyl-terminal processing protease